ncbi:acyltransferase family protein [Streptomyces sp. DH41]|uniref:acyltransferase family protein n=1 Tax=Streptomyces sp. DH41 TaxID=3040125 RepID=UPI00244321C8|nr:acyltransferase [Streptomyces sp. DH41]MDG9721748.1 acyltransferase [Streptomyces sp. DH41]
MTHGYTTGTGTNPEPAGPYGSPYAGDPNGAAGMPYDVPRQRTTEFAPGFDSEPAPAPAPQAPPAAKKPGRDRYLDLLRSVALVRVVVYHIFGWAWLTVLFPSMGVMFALAGSLMARSLKRPAMGVIRGRVRRLLPPMWAFAAVVLTMMFVNGWNPTKDPEGGAWGLIELFNYIVPIGAPPYPWHVGSPSGLLEDTWAVQAAGPLWYLRAYLWFVIASPLLLWLFRKAPWPTLLAPLGLTAIVGTGVVTIPGETGLAITDFAVYGGCWVLGFAHHEGLLKQIPRYVSVSCASLVMAFGLWWASNHLGPDGWDLNDIPLAQATWSFGFVVILLQYSPSWQELPGRLAKWDKLITLSNNRAVTIYLWHNLLIMATVPIIDLAYRLPFMQNERAMNALTDAYTIWMLALVWPLIGLMVLAVGWVEDLAAKRKPRLWPNGTKRGDAAKGAGGTGSRRRSRSGAGRN